MNEFLVFLNSSILGFFVQFFIIVLIIFFTIMLSIIAILNIFDVIDTYKDTIGKNKNKRSKNND